MNHQSGQRSNQFGFEPIGRKPPEGPAARKRCRCWGQIQLAAQIWRFSRASGGESHPRLRRPPVHGAAKTRSGIRPFHPGGTDPATLRPGQETHRPSGVDVVPAEVAHQSNGSRWAPPAGLRAGNIAPAAAQRAALGRPTRPPRADGCPGRQLLQGRKGRECGRPVHSGEHQPAAAPTPATAGGAQREWPRKRRARKEVAGSWRSPSLTRRGFALILACAPGPAAPKPPRTHGPKPWPLTQHRSSTSRQGLPTKTSVS